MDLSLTMEMLVREGGREGVHVIAVVMVCAAGERALGKIGKVVVEIMIVVSQIGTVFKWMLYWLL